MYRLTADGKLIEADADDAAEAGGVSGAPAASSPASPAAAAAARSPSTAAPGGHRWTVHTGGGRACVVEYTYATMDILVNDIKAAVEGEFVEEEELEGGGGGGGGGGGAAAARAATVSGVRYKLLLGPSLLEAQLTVIPNETGRGPPECALVANGVIIRPQGGT
jgi:hypothetical protein